MSESNYEWLCRRFKQSYHDDAVDTPSIVAAGIVGLSKGRRTIQFILTSRDESDTIFDLDKVITQYRKGNPHE
jgi:hypothetical protein